MGNKALKTCEANLEKAQTTCGVAEGRSIAILEKGEYARFVDGKMVIEAKQGGKTYKLTVDSIGGTMLFNNKVYKVTMEEETGTPREVQAFLRTDASMLSFNEVGAYIWTDEGGRKLIGAGKDTPLDDTHFVEGRLATAKLAPTDRWTLQVGELYKKDPEQEPTLPSDVIALTNKADRLFFEHKGAVPATKGNKTVTELKSEYAEPRRFLLDIVKDIVDKAIPLSIYEQGYLYVSAARLSVTIAENDRKLAEHEFDQFKEEADDHSEKLAVLGDSDLGYENESTKKEANDVTISMNNIILQYLTLDTMVAATRLKIMMYIRDFNHNTHAFDDEHEEEENTQSRDTIESDIANLRKWMKEADEAADEFTEKHRTTEALSAARNHAKYLDMDRGGRFDQMMNKNAVMDGKAHGLGFMFTLPR